MDIVMIPAFNPDMKLVGLVNELYERNLKNIIIVNDGSEYSSLEIFAMLHDRAVILTHDVNRGKGAAIKTALKFITNNQTDDQGIVIMDADGQHRPTDALRLLNSLHSNQSDMVLGVRNLSSEIPFRSLFGNTITKYAFRLCSGKWISDTQTGLRAFSSDMITRLLEVRGERYEYEMNVLLTCAKNGCSITEVPIATIYHNNNSGSHFRAIKDSARIYSNLLAFSGASFLSFLLDYLIFFPFVWIFYKLGTAINIAAAINIATAINTVTAEGAALICGNIAARLVSAAFNYYLNSTFVFRQMENRRKSIFHYAMLACAILVLNTFLLYGLHNLLGLNKALAKLVTELVLFIISFSVQRFIIFNKNMKKVSVSI